jgi:hypothetical protein
MRDDHDRLAARAHLVEALQTTTLKLGVTHREYLVDEEDVGVHVDRHGEAETHVHAGRVVPHRCVDELLDPGEAHDLVEPRVQLPLGESEDRPVEVHVLAAGEILVEPGAQLQERGDLPSGFDRSLVGTQDLGDALEHRALARTVLTDEPERRSLGYVERHVPQRPELLVAGAASSHHRRLQ